MWSLVATFASPTESFTSVIVVAVFAVAFALGFSFCVVDLSLVSLLVALVWRLRGSLAPLPPTQSSLTQPTGARVARVPVDTLRNWLQSVLCLLQDHGHQSVNCFS